MRNNSPSTTNRQGNPWRAAAAASGWVAAAGAAASAGWIAYSSLAVNHHERLPPAIDAVLHGCASKHAGGLAYYGDSHADGKPLLLLHSINACASSYEVRPLFEAFRSQRSVYALDLPGFGFSERSDREYLPGLYAEAIVDFTQSQIHRDPADVVALSLTCEFAALAVLARPDLFRSLTLISPTGFGRQGDEGSSPEARRHSSRETMYPLLSFPLWSQAVYDLIVTPRSIRHFLDRTFSGPVDEGLARYDYLTSHQPGAKFAPLQFISGRLFTPDVRWAVYSKLALPVLTLFDQDPYVDFDALPAFEKDHANWTATRIPGTRGLPHFEKLGETVGAMERFWQDLPARFPEHHPVKATQ